MICRKIYIFILVSISFSSLADEQVYLTCNCTRAINSIITEGGCWDEEILITIDKKNKKLEWGSLEYPSLRQWMDYEIDGNNFFWIIFVSVLQGIIKCLSQSNGNTAKIIVIEIVLITYIFY